MIMKTSAGDLVFSREAIDQGPFFCSTCGQRIRVGAIYTKQAVYHPITGKQGVMARCTTCLPVVEAPEAEYKHAVVPTRLPPEIEKFERLDTVVWGNPDAHTTGSMRPVTPESYGSRSFGTTPVQGWERQAPQDVSDVLTRSLESIRRVERREREHGQHHFTDKIRRVLHLSTGNEGWLR